MTDLDRRILLGIAGVAGATAISHLTAGSLNPPTGPVAPTMLPLDQVEPRTPVDATHTPPAGPSDTFTISAPGSYFLTGNIAGTTNTIIHITAPDVTLDLRGFVISGNGNNLGVWMDPTASRCTVCNGAISGCGNGVGTDSSAQGHTFRNLVVSGAGNVGISAGYGALVDGCHVQGCSGYAGIYTYDGCVVTRSSVVNSTSNYGIFVGQGSTVAHCAVQRNVYSGSTNVTTASAIRAYTGCTVIGCSLTANTAAAGILADPGSTISQCSVAYQSGSNNLPVGVAAAGISAQGCSVIDCTVSYGTTNSPIGFYVGASSTVRGCTAYANGGDGFLCDYDCHLTGNIAHNGLAHGFHLTGTGNTVDGNNSNRNSGTGIYSSGGAPSSNVIVRNYSFANGTNYNPSSGGNIGPVGNASTTTNPWANFS